MIPSPSNDPYQREFLGFALAEYSCRPNLMYAFPYAALLRGWVLFHGLTRGGVLAGQGYIWLAHRQPQSAAWDLAARSKQLWEDQLLPLQYNAHEEARKRIGVEWQVQYSVAVFPCS